jgi:hypothetical protein
VSLRGGDLLTDALVTETNASRKGDSSLKAKRLGSAEIFGVRRLRQRSASVAGSTRGGSESEEHCSRARGESCGNATTA